MWFILPPDIAIRMRSSPNAFADAREEIQLWPAAAMAYYFTIHDSRIVLALFLLSIWTGATTYKMHEAVRTVMKEGKSISAVRQRVSRDKKGDDSTSVIETALDFWELLCPDNSVARFTVGVGMLVNLCLGLYLFVWLGERLLRSPSPSVTAISLFALPVLMLAAMGASLVWSS